MKFQIMTDILFTLLEKRKVSAGELSSKYHLSLRSIHRYIDEMTVAGIPIDVARGAAGGISIPASFKLPAVFMTGEEYAAALGAMREANGRQPDPALTSAISKLAAQANGGAGAHGQ